MRLVGRGATRRLVPYNLTFTLTELHRRAMRPGGTRAEGGGEGAQMGRGKGAGWGGGGIAGGEGGRGVKGDRDIVLYFKF
jgi:hypothetical protein